MNSEWPDWTANLPSVLYRTFLGAALWQWLGILVLALASYVGYWIGHWVAVRLLRIRAKLFTTPLANGPAAAARRAIGMLCGVVFGYLVLGELALQGHLQGVVNGALVAANIGAVALLVHAFWDALCDDIAARATGSERAERLLVPMARKFVRAIIFVVAILVGATELFQADVRGIVASLGLGGLVVALAAKDSVENLFGSLTILFDMPFAIGDWVKIDKTEGIVEEINLRSTRIRTFEDTVINVPNANLIRASVENVSARRTRRQQISVRISYDTRAASVDAFCRDVRQWLEDHPKILPGRSIVEISEMAEPSMGVLVQTLFEVKSQSEELELRHALFLEILRLREVHHVLFAAAPRPLDTVYPAP